MELIGYMDSPFVRRVAVTAKLLGVEFVHRELSVFRDFEELSAINPLVKVPTLVCEDGQVLVDSALILDYLESRVGGSELMPSDEARYVQALSAIGTAMIANEKIVQLIYELDARPQEMQHDQWTDRIQAQLTGAFDVLEQQFAEADPWLFGDSISQADITAAISWAFGQFRYPERIPAANYPALAALSERAEALPEFKACPIS